METSTNAKKEYLKTHFYNNTYLEAKEVIIDLLKSRMATLVSVNDTYMEIATHDYAYDCTIILSYDKVLSIDLFVMAPILYSKKKYIKEFYKHLDSKLNLERIGE